jgi:E3 ubiquitin-protein ligase RNF14
VLLRHLEPMELVVTLDDAYPASQPLVELRCSWLEAGQVSGLVQALRELSLSSGAGGSLFAMFELVRYQGVALSCGSDDASGAPVVAVRSARALARLRAYAAAQFPSEVHCCGMCFEELPGARLKQLPCSHPYCMPCLERFAELHVREGSVGSLVCCAARCGCPLPPQLVGELLAKKDPRAAERYEEMLLRKGLEAMGDVAPCPRCQAVCVADADGIALCQCFFSFCTKCRGEYHPGTPCLTLAKKIADLEERLAREADREAAMQGLSLAERAALLHVSLQGKQGGAALSANAVAQDRSALQNELATLRTMLDMGARQCPRCRLYALKSEGCNKMVCSQCQCLWCYRCGADISNEGYQHFRVAELGERGAAPCAGRLFEEEDVRRNNAQFNRELLRARQDGAHAPPVRCPGCQAWCVKFNNNNHLRCVNCPAAFCCLCRQIVTKPGLHFGPGRCKQHS